ncbi:MAG TPA: SDR family oxidoreductase [Thermoleophilaceae bacterium]
MEQQGALTLEEKPPATEPPAGLLAGKRILVTGVLTNRSLAYHAAVRMQELGAEVILTGFGRAKRLTQRATATMPRTPEVLELDVQSDDDFRQLADDLDERWGGVDGALHSVAFAPPDLFKQPFLEASIEDVEVAARISAYSLQPMARVLLPLMERNEGGGTIAALTVDPRVRVHPYAWMTVMKSTLTAVARQLAVEVAPHGLRVNLIAAGPVRTNAASAIPEFDEMEKTYSRAPLGWDARNHAAIAGAACFLMSDLSQGMTGDVLHVDGGMHILI